MIMAMIKSAWSFLTVLLFLSLLDFSSGTILLSYYNTIKEPGDNFMVICKDDSGGSVSWSGPKGPLGAETHPKVEVSSFGSSLVFIPIIKEYGGSYTCRMGQEIARFNLTVLDPLKFMETPAVQVGRENTDMTLRCEVNDGDKSVLTWTSEGKELTSPKYEQMRDGLLIRNVTRADSKTYTCRATQLNTGNTRDQNIKLIVEYKPVPRHPHLWKQGDLVWGFIGSDVNLTCEAEANPVPKFEWYRKNRVVVILKDRTIYEPHRSILQLHISNSLFFGDYKCKAWNKLGKLDKYISLQQGVQPEPPEVVELKKALARSLDLDIRGPDMENKTIALSMEPIGYRVQFKEVEDKTDWGHAGTIDFPKGKPYTIFDLANDTSYEIHVATRNLAGISEYSNSSIFKTLKSSAQGFFLMSPYFIFATLSFPILRTLIL